MSWALYRGNYENWEKDVTDSKSSSHFHDNEWAENLKGLGWLLCRWEYQTSAGDIAFLQGFLKRFPFGVGVLWFPDWIVGDYKFGNGITRVLQESLSLRFLTIHLRSHHKKNEEELKVLGQDFSLASNPFGSGLTMHLDLAIPCVEIHQNLTKNWKRNLKRSTKLDYEIIEVTDVDVIHRLYYELSQAKGMREFLSRKQIESLVTTHRDRLVVIGSKTPDGVVQAIRGAIIRGNKAVDIFAAANVFSRKHYLSYALCWDLIIRCRDLGCDIYDFSGVDPAKNVGVYNFKKGTGAKLVETLGEFEYSNSVLMDKLIKVASRL